MQVIRTIGLLLSFGLMAVPRSSFANEIFELGKRLPGMELIVCRDLVAAKMQAFNSRELGRFPYDAARVKRELLASNCYAALVSVLPKYKETSIEPYLAWSDVVQKNGPETTSLEYNNIVIYVATNIEKQYMQWYYSETYDLNGSKSRAFVEIPANPYGVIFADSNIDIQNSLRRPH